MIFSQLPGEKLEISAPLLPAEATSSAPAAMASLIAACSVAVQIDAPPKLILMTSAGFGLRTGRLGSSTPADQRMASAASEANPPHLPNTRTGKITAL